MGRGERIIVSGLLILTLLLSTIPLTSASESKSERDYVTYTTTENYSPGNFNLEISDNNPPDSSDGSDSGTLTRGWVENTYEKAVIENFPATRQVLDHYDREPAYYAHGGWSCIANDAFGWGSAFKDHINEIVDDLRRRGRARNTLYHLEYWRDEGFWLHTYIKRFHRSRYNWLTEKLEPNSFEEWDYGFQVFQGFFDWRRKSVVVNTLPGAPEDFYLWMPYQKRFIYEHGSYKIPVYKEEEYTRWRTTTYQINDWTPDNWPAINAQITLTGTNGYEEDVQLSVTTDTELLDASLGDQVVHVGSTATTNLTIQPQRELSGSRQITRTRKVVDHYATRKIYDTRQVFTGRYRRVYVGRKWKVVGHKWKTRTVTKHRWVPGHYVTRHHLVWKPIRRRYRYRYWYGYRIIGYYPSYEPYRRWVSGHWESYTTTERYKKPVYGWVKQYRKEPIYRTERYVKRTERYPVYRKQKYTVPTSGSIHTITVTATDDYGRTKQATYSLELQASEKPPVENAILSIEETDVKPSDPTKPSTYRPGSRRGVEGSVYDVQTREGVSSGLSVTVDGHSADKVWGNNYRYIDYVNDYTFNGHTFTIIARASGHKQRTVHAFDYEGDYKIAQKDIYLQPSPYS